MKKYEEKFIVINKKHLKKFIDETGNITPVKLLENSIHNFYDAYEKEFSEELNQKYYVCNQDEPYAQQIIDIILDNNNAKNN